MNLKKIKILRSKFNQYNIDGYIIPKNDEYFSEYAKNDRLKKITGFSGSAGFAVVLKKQNYLFVDGRYTIQAHQQSSKIFKIIEIHKKLPHTIFKNFNLGYDPKLFTSKLLGKYFMNNNLISIDQNLIDQIFKFKEKQTKPFYSLDIKIVGEAYSSKISKVVRFLKKNKADFCFISAPENVAWLLNIRGYDNPNSPIANARIILNKKKELYLVANKNNLKNLLLDKKIKKKQILPINLLPQFLDNLKGKNFIIDNKTCSIFYEKIIKTNFNILKLDDPVYNLKSIKNSVEIKHMIEAHKKDGLALTKFIYWIKNVNKKKITEVYAQNKLEKYRKLNKDYLFPSFDTIAGAGLNGAIVHYRANKKTTKKIEQSDILLVDSGGQYHYGTTDVTRTISFSTQSKFIKNTYTNILKGHIAVALTNLNKDNTGKKIDIKARKFLKKEGQDYAHGTGHGVGFFLNVHEGPQSISKYNSIKIKNGMILSNEPGFYKKNYFGIRIENLIYAKETKKSFNFENLTLAPLEKDLINYELLNKTEKNYLFRYHLNIYSEFSSLLNRKERKWLATLI